MDTSTTSRLRERVQEMKTASEPSDDFLASSPQSATATTTPAAPAESVDPSAPAAGTVPEGPGTAPAPGNVSDGQYYDRAPTAGGGTGEQPGVNSADFLPHTGDEPATDFHPVDGAGLIDPPTTPTSTWTGPTVIRPPQPSSATPEGGASLGIQESANSPWGGSKPEFLENQPGDMPKATVWNVTPEQTVSGQMASLMENDNPTFKAIREQIQRARVAAGGQNSLMASRAAVTAMASMAFQIGSADAATFARSAEFNAAMSNQFGLAEQQFMHNAMLSDQNYRQALTITRAQIAGQMQLAEAQISGQLAAINANGAVNMQLEDARNAHTLQQMDRAHGAELENAELGFQHTWALGEQGQGHALEQMDRSTENNIRTGTAATDQQIRAENNQFNHQLQLTVLTELGANSRQLTASLGDIRGNPNITAAQAAAAGADLVYNFNQTNNLIRGYATNPVPGTGTSGGETGGGTGGADAGAGTTTGSTGTPAPYTTAAYNYTRYSLGYGGYSMVPPPTTQFWGGSGVAEEPMYGSNPGYGETGQVPEGGGYPAEPGP